MPTDKPLYLAYSAHCDKPTEGLSLVEMSAHYKEAVRLENLYLASIPEWKMAVAMLAVPVALAVIVLSIILVCFYFFPTMTA